MNSNARAWGHCLLLAATTLVGCSRGPREYAVSGEVSFRGEKVAAGEIVFADAAGVGPSAHGFIIDGQYSVQSTAGPKRVRITSTRETGKMVAGGMDVQVPERVDWIPPQYNAQSQLEYEVTSSGAQSVDFHLP